MTAQDYVLEAVRLAKQSADRVVSAGQVAWSTHGKASGCLAVEKRDCDDALRESGLFTRAYELEEWGDLVSLWKLK